MRKRYRVPKRIRKRGKWWCFRITDSFGKRRQIKCATEEEARAKMRAMPQQIMSEISGTASYRITLEQGIAYWLAHKNNTIVSGSYDRFSTMGDHLLEFRTEQYPKIQFFAETQEKEDFALNYRNYRLSKGRATKTVHDEEVMLTDLYNFLAKKKKIKPINPFIELEPLTVEPVQQRHVMPKGDLKKFFEGATAISKEIYWYGVYMVLYFTNIRRDELRLMLKTWVNFETGFFEIPSAKNKKGKVVSKTVPIHPQLKLVLVEMMRRSKTKYLAPNDDGKPMPKNKMRDTMLRICKKVGIPKATLNDLRHTWSTKTLLDGMPKESRREVGGWNSFDVMDEVYTHYPEKQVVEDYSNVDFMDFLNEPDPKGNAKGINS